LFFVAPPIEFIRTVDMIDKIAVNFFLFEVI